MGYRKFYSRVWTLDNFNMMLGVFLWGRERERESVEVAFSGRVHVVAFSYLNFMSRQRGSIKRLTIIFNNFGQSIKVGLRQALTIIKLELLIEVV